MVNPVPDFAITTPFGRRGTWWSCRRDASGQGIHTGADWAAPLGTPIVAARGGIVRHVNFGSAFGPNQFAIDPGDGTRDFYAHNQGRPANGARVATGQRVATVASLGNSSGPHLHFERHRNTNGWTCDVQVDPAPSIDFQEGTWFDMATQDDLRRVVREELERNRPPQAAAVWAHEIEGQPARWYQRTTWRIARRFLGPGGDAPDQTMLARVDRNTRPG